MIRSLLLLSLASATLTALGQDKDIRITPNWVLGDTRVVRTTMSLRMHMSDSMDMKMNGSGSYHLSVKEKKKDRSVLSQTLTDADALPSMHMDMTNAPVELQVAMDGIMGMMERLTDTMTRPMRGLQLDFNVGPNAEVYGMVQNDAQKLKLLDAMVLGTQGFVGQMAKDLPGAPIPTKPQLYHLCDSLYDAMVETLRNEMIYLLDGYHYAYPATGSKREPMIIKDVQAPMNPDMPELPAMVEYGFDEIDANHAVSRVVLQYDQEALRQAFAAEGQKLERIGMTEERVYRFDRRSGWLTGSDQSMTLLMGDMRIYLSTHSELKTK